jgi:hypothetical protein
MSRYIDRRRRKIILAVKRYEREIAYGSRPIVPDFYAVFLWRHNTCWVRGENADHGYRMRSDGTTHVLHKHGETTPLHRYIGDVYFAGLHR